MDNKEDSEQSFVKALLVLGPAPPKPRKIRGTLNQNYFRSDVDRYLAQMKYADEVEKYFLIHVLNDGSFWQGAKWTDEFYEWQKKTRRTK